MLHGKVELYNALNCYFTKETCMYINMIFRFAAAKRNGDEYFILLIITDGIITDMPQTCEAIVNVSKGQLLKT